LASTIPTPLVSATRSFHLSVARRVYALEAVEDLEPVAGREHEDRRELPMKRERPSHRLDRRRLADAERTETLAEVGEGHAHGGDGCSVIHVR
jgi:hypothetical protein